MKLPDFTKYFNQDIKLSDESYGKYSIYPKEVGKLIVPSGYIVACDPFVFYDYLPFTKQIESGVYPVFLSIFKRSSGDERVAFAMLRISDRQAVKWELAITSDDDISKLEEDEYYGYPVDAGTGCFMSHEASCLLASKMDEDGDYYEKIQEKMEINYIHTRDWVDFQLDADSGLNLIAFSSGFGDGIYPSYWGYDKAGEIVCLVTDFKIIPDN